MTQLVNVEAAQRSLEECFTKRMAELESQLQCTSASKDTVARVAEEFRTFRELMFSMLGLLRKQISECAQAIDAMDTRHRRKALLLMGVVESKGEDCGKVTLDIINNRLQLRTYSAESLTVCHRLGTPNTDHHRPILVRFGSLELRSAVWRAKTALKGAAVSIREFLTKTRQTVFAKARNHFGTRACWTQDGTIVIKVDAGNRCKITTAAELSDLISKHPKSLHTVGAYARSGIKGNTSSGPNKNKKSPTKT